MLNEMQKIFVLRVINVCFYNYYECVEIIIIKFSEKEVLYFILSRSSDRFVYGWLVDKSIFFCKMIGLYWLVYEEGQGMYCFFCRKYNIENVKNKFKVYNFISSVYFKKLVIKDYLLFY